MRLSHRTISAPPWLRGLGGAIAPVVLLAGLTPAAWSADVEPLALVPSSAGVFAHLRVGDLWKSSLVAETQKALGKDLDKLLGEFEKEVGLRLETIETATFVYPTMPMGPGDEQTFMVIVTTNKPYDKDTLLRYFRKGNAKEKDGFLALTDKILLNFAGPNSFVVLHESLVEKFKKGLLGGQKPGAMSEALKLAGDKHHFVFAQDFSQLPSEIFTAAQAELQPFLPLLKTKSSVLFADLKQKKITLGLNFTGADANSGQEAERSFKLLMKLASDGLADVLKDERVKKEIGPLLPALKELERGVKAVKVTLNGNRLETSMTLNADLPIGAMVKEIAAKMNQGAGRSQNLNNLKQIGLAMHNYHDTYNGFPPASICDKKGKPLLSWRVAILPYIEHGELYKEFKLDEPWDSEHNKKLIEKMPKTYAAPEEKASEGKTHYRVFVGNGAVFDLIQQTKITEIPDGTSNTIMVVDAAEGTPWTKPDDFEYDPKLAIEKLLRFVDSRTTVAFCDGSVRLLKKGLAEKTWHALIGKADGLVADLPND